MRTSLKILGIVLTLTLAALAAPTQAVVIGAGAPNQNCFPFGCNAAGTRYQQVYDDAAFGGPITITTINFFLASGFTTLNTGTYTMSFSHSVNPVDALSSTFEDNVGADDTVFGVFVVGGSAPLVLSFSGAPFVYDGLGDLLLDMHITLTDEGNAFYRAHFETAAGVFSRMHNFGGAFEGSGLVTEFVGGAAVVPVPTTLALLGIGLVGLGLNRRKRK